jgi:SPP1 family predicted phage head-tail adaptor
MRERVTIQAASLTTTSAGLVSSFPGDGSGTTVWAKVRPLRALELLRGEQVGQETDYIVNIRYGPTIDATCRLLWRSKLLYIVGTINVDARRRELEITCSERAPANG